MLRKKLLLKIINSSRFLKYLNFNFVNINEFNYFKMDKKNPQKNYSLNNYIKDLKEYLTNCKTEKENYKELFLVIGNKSCDMDSFISSLLLSLFRNLYNQNNNIKCNKNLKQINPNDLNKIYIPILNCKKDEFNDRLDISYLCQIYNLKKENFIFWDDEILLNFFSNNTNNNLSNLSKKKEKRNLILNFKF
jgi:hypothetical protein